MPFNQFTTFEQLKTAYGLRFYAKDLFENVPPVEAPDWLPGYLAEGVGLRKSDNSEIYAREFLSRLF